jgi:hypothetical protein
MSGLTCYHKLNFEEKLEGLPKIGRAFLFLVRFLDKCEKSRCSKYKT